MFEKVPVNMYYYHEVAKHNKTSDCWVILHDYIYNLTNFLSKHPGGKRAILEFAGKDATDDFEMIHPTGVIDAYLSKDNFIGQVIGSKL